MKEPLPLYTPYPHSHLNDRSVAFYLFLCIALLWPFIFFLLLFMRTEYVDWVLVQCLKGIWRCPFPVVRVDGIEPDTPQPSVCRFSFSLPNVFHLQKSPPSKYLSRPKRRLSRVPPAFPFMPTLIQSQFVVAAAFSIPFYLPRTPRSFKFFMPLFKPSSTLFSRFCCCTITRFFRIFILCFITWAIALLVIDPHYVPLPHALLKYLLPPRRSSCIPFTWSPPHRSVRLFPISFPSFASHVA